MATRALTEQQLDFQHIRAVLKKFAERNDFIIKGKIVLQPQVLCLKSKALSLAANTEYPVCSVEAYRRSYSLKNKTRYFLIYNMASQTPDDIIPLCETSSPRFREIRDYFVLDGVKYLKNNDGFIKI